MRIDIATLFPEMCEAVLCESIIGRAREAGLLEVYCHNIRDYTQDKHRRVDDTPYGGGMGMVMQADPIFRCYEAVCAQLPQKPHVIYLSPQGKVLTQQMAVEYSRQQYLFLLCGHYEGVDEPGAGGDRGRGAFHRRLCTHRRGAACAGVCGYRGAAV